MKVLAHAVEVAVALAILNSACGAKTGLELGDPVREPSCHVAVASPTCVDLPYGGPDVEVDVSLAVCFESVDLLLLVDTSGSMFDVVENLQSSFRSIVVPRVAAVVPDPAYSLATFVDFPVEPYGAAEAGDHPFALRHASVSDPTTVELALEDLSFGWGRDEPESATEALYLAATGEAFAPFVPPGSCRAGTVGYACLRPMAGHFIVLITDAPFHNGPDGTEPYVGIAPAPHTYQQALSALLAIGAHVVSLDCSGSGPNADLTAIARDTGSQTQDGEALAFDGGADGAGVPEAIVEAVDALMERVPRDVVLQVDDLAGDDGDSSAFIQEISAREAVPPRSAVLAGDHFDAAMPGARLRFSVRLRNATVQADGRPRHYGLELVASSPTGGWRVSSTVDVVIPVDDAEECNP